MTELEIQIEIDKINKLSQYEMCHLWRFSHPGHPYFDRSSKLFGIFHKRLKQLGVFILQNSKYLG